MDAHTDDRPADSGSRVRVMDSRKILFDGEVFLDDFDDWSKAVFVILAGERGLTRITDQHLRVVRVLRAYYAYHGRAPLNRQLREGTGLSVMENGLDSPNQREYRRWPGSPHFSAPGTSPDKMLSYQKC